MSELAADANCASCHSSWRFTDDSFHDIGVANDDLGRGKLVNLDPMQHAFKTPTLRNVARRAPYMHDGSDATLEDVIELYDPGGRQRRPSLAREIRPLQLSDQDKLDLVEFSCTRWPAPTRQFSSRCCPAERATDGEERP